MHFLPGPGLLLIIRSIILTASFIFSTFCVSRAQSNFFTPAGDDVRLLRSLYAKYEQQYHQEIATLPTENKKDLAELYQLRWENVREKFDNKEIFSAADAQQYLDLLIAEIVKANPPLNQQQFSCFFSKSGVPNASYIGEGVILFNMGLFKMLENESQAAFVLCHELSHLFLHHSENSIKKYVNTINSKEVQHELQKIKSHEYKKREDLEKLLKSLTFNSRRHSRDHESEADSMAVEFMRATRFDTRESLTTLALLDSIDIDTINTELFLRKTFNAKEYPFQKRWIAKEEGLLGGHAVLKEDEPMAASLKTHPDCKARMRILENLLVKFPAAMRFKDIIDKSKFASLKTTFRYEVIEYAFTRNNYTQSLYYTLQLLQTNPSDPYLVTQVGKIFNGLYNAQKNHTLGKVTSLPGPHYHSNYNLLLQFIQNLYKEDYASVSHHFLNQYYQSLQQHAPFKNEYNTSIQIAQQ